jgi:hypothetical protein
MKIKGYKIKYTSKYFTDNNISKWGACHSIEAHAYHKPFPYSKNTILIQRGLSPTQKRKTMMVLQGELSRMSRGMSYKKAHRLANREVK